MSEFLRVAGLFALTAAAEIVGCYLPWLVLRQGKPAWLLLPAAASLALFAWLLTLHPSAAGRTLEGPEPKRPSRGSRSAGMVMSAVTHTA